MKQSKITAFWANSSVRNEGNGTPQSSLGKRKISDENVEIPQKKVFLHSDSPDIFSGLAGKSPKKSGSAQLFAVENEKENQLTVDLEGISFDDFENNPFLSPQKKSPGKGILTENFSLSPNKINLDSDCDKLNFETPLKCKVLKTVMVTTDRYEQQILVIDEQSQNTGLCKLRDTWMHSSFCVNDKVVIQTIKSNDGWVVNNNIGYVVLHPDVVISSTSLVSSMFCMRQGLLSTFYKGIEPGSNSKMLIGRLVHELLQECLKTRSCNDQQFTDTVSKFLQSHEYLHDFYFSGMNVVEAKLELESFSPRIKNFIDVYVKKEVKPSGKNFKGSIEEVLDIEELIRSPNLGFQGRIDVTVKVKKKNSENVAPLELKTGRASFSTEHKSQLILYVLLMNEIGRKVESGLLLYLKDGIMEEVVPQRDEIRNLFLLRNQLVRYYKSIGMNELPEPIRLVKACSKCAYLRICTSYLKNEESESVYDTHPIKNIEIPDIKESHVQYFTKWNKMLWIEYGSVLNSDTFDEGLDGLKLMPGIEQFGSDFKHNFIINPGSMNKGFPVGTFVHLYDSKNNRISTAKVIEISSSVCSLSLDKKLNDFLETYKISVFKLKFLNFYLSNLGWFLNEQFQSLRELIIDKRAPAFEEKLRKKSFKEKCLSKLLSLNLEQRKAVVKSLLAKDYLLIKGPPGTGKTETIVALVRVLVALDKSVLLTGHTNSSVDNILLRLNDVEFLRLGSVKNVKKELLENCYSKLIGNCTNVDDVKKLFDRKVIASTCVSIDSDFVHKKKFDVCIVDESSQVLQPEVLRPLFCCKKFILVGDEDQLPPIVINPEAKLLGMSQSMFEWMKNDSASVVLKLQYRMNSVINYLANAITYDGLIKCANEDVASATLKIINHKEYLKEDRWVQEILSADLEKSVIFIDTSQYFVLNDLKNPERPRSSKIEAAVATKLLKSLLSFGLEEDTIGVISPFTDQIMLMKKKLSEAYLTKVELNTVDQYQGRDKNLILFSCGKENQTTIEASENELLNDVRRLTVSVTRARHKLLFVGDKRTIVRYEPFKKLIKCLKEPQIVHLKDGENDFFWKNLSLQD